MIRNFLHLSAFSLLGLLLILSIADTFPLQWPLPERTEFTSLGSLQSALIEDWNLENIGGIVVVLAFSSLPIALSCWFISQWSGQGRRNKHTPSLLTPLTSLGGAFITVMGLALVLSRQEPSLPLLLLLIFSPSLTLLFSLRSWILLTTSCSRRREGQQAQEREQP